MSDRLVGLSSCPALRLLQLLPQRLICSFLKLVEQGEGLDSGLRYRGLAMLESVPEALLACGHQAVVDVIRLIEQGTHVSFPLSRVQCMYLLLLCLFLD